MEGPRLAILLRFVDDGFCLSRVNYENSLGFVVNGTKHRIKHAIQCQNVFRHLVRNAEEIGMKVNTDKTTLVCFSDAQGTRRTPIWKTETGRSLEEPTT